MGWLSLMLPTIQAPGLVWQVMPLGAAAHLKHRMYTGVLQCCDVDNAAIRHCQAVGTARVTCMRGGPCAAASDTGSWGACASITLPAAAAACSFDCHPSD